MNILVQIGGLSKVRELGLAQFLQIRQCVRHDAREDPREMTMRETGARG